ncbi:MAG: hypothetical protein AB7V58_10175 [Solirubrobacterales bacterium]
MRRDGRRLVALIVAVACAAFALGAVSPSSARADVCDKIPSIPGVPNPVKTGCEAVGAVPGAVTDPGGAVTDIVTAPIKAAGDEVMQGVTKWVADGAGWLVGQAGKLIDATTTPRLDSPWFGQQYKAMAALAAVFALPLLLLSVLQSVMRRDSSIVVRAAFVHLPAAFILTAGAVAVVLLFLQLTDEMCTQVSSSVGSDAGSFFKDTTDALGKLGAATGQGGAPLFAVFLGGLIAAIGAFFVWIELVLRSAAVYVTVLFLPFTFVAMIWPATARWCRRLVELLFAVIFSKFVIVAILALAAAGLGQSRSDDAFQGVIAGAALMLLAALSPMALLKLIPLAEAAVAHSHGRSGSGAQTLGPIAGPAATMRRVVDANWGGAGGGGLRAAPAGAGAAGGPAGFAAAAVAGGAGAMAGGVRTRADNIGGTGGGQGPRGEDSVRYAAVGGGGQAARPSAAPPAGQQPSSGEQRGASASDKGGGSAPRSGPDQSQSRGAGAPRPIAPGRDLGGDRQRPSDKGGAGDGR